MKQTALGASRDPSVAPVGCRWVFTTKKVAEGRIVRYKARLVAEGFSQQFGVNYFETYTPVANANLIRVFLAVCYLRQYSVKQFDFKMAFPNGTLTEKVLMKVPGGALAEGDVVCSLNKSFYGLKEAAYVWNETIKAALSALEFAQSSTDECIFGKKTDHGQIYVYLYVDDLLIGVRDDVEISSVSAQLGSKFKLSVTCSCSSA